jgi:hypothetical protein
MASTMERTSSGFYIVACMAAGLVLGWAPYFIHGPIPEKFDPHFIRGSMAVWAYYLPRLSIGFWVGVAVWPRRWFVRGPLVGALLLVPPGFLSLAVPECGPT